MAKFTIEDKEHELKITYKSIKHLDSLYEGGSFELIGKAMMGDLDTFPHIVYAALMHTGENYTLAMVESAMDDAIEAEQMNLDSIIKISNEVVTNSNFYAATVSKLMAKDKSAKKMLDELLKD